MKIHSIVSMFILAGCLLVTPPAGAFGSGKECQKHTGHKSACEDAKCYYNHAGSCVNKKE